MIRSDSTRTALGAIAVVAVAVWNARDLRRHWADNLAEATSGADIVLGLRIAAMVAQVLFALLALHRAFAAERPVAPTAARLRALLAFVPATALVAATLARALPAVDAASQLPRSVFFIVLLTGSGALLVWPAAGRAVRPLGRIAAVVGINAIATLVVLELVLSVWARAAPSPLLAGGALETRVAAARPKPHTNWFGRRLNAGGYHDGDFFVAGERDLVVAVLADSFGIGVVPYEENYVTIAESALRDEVGARYERVALHNFGVPAIGLEEYAYLLETEAVATRPARVVLCVFVGNDVTSDHPFGAPGPGRYALQDWLVGKLPARLLARARSPGYVEALAALDDPPAPAGADREAPTHSPEHFLDVESRRLDVTHTHDRRVVRRYARFFEGLDYFYERLGERLIVLVFPDEFQVNDALWEQALARKEALAHSRDHSRQHSRQHYERDLPQRRIAAWADERGVPLVDTTATLRAAQREAPVYALRNTHLNARGNEIVGLQLAEALASTLSPLPPSSSLSREAPRPNGPKGRGASAR